MFSFTIVRVFMFSFFNRLEHDLGKWNDDTDIVEIYSCSVDAEVDASDSASSSVALTPSAASCLSCRETTPPLMVSEKASSWLAEAAVQNHGCAQVCVGYLRMHCLRCFCPQFGYDMFSFPLTCCVSFHVLCGVSS